MRRPRRITPTDRIVEEFDRLVALEPEALAARPLAEQIVFWVVATRCEIDIDGFASVYEQLLKPEQLRLLTDGLHRLDEGDLASEFQRGFALLEACGFYGHLNWNIITQSVKNEIDTIGERIGSRLWDLDEKLVTLLDNRT